MIAFGGCLWGSFHFDDYSLFSASLWRPFDIRPLTYLTFWINERLGGANPAGYHAVNLMLHAIAAVLLWEALRKLVPQKAAWLAAAIFAVHPLQAEAVNYVFERSTLLATALCLVSLGSWLRGRRWLAVAWFAAALLAKEECVAFPAFLWLMETGGRPRAGRDAEGSPLARVTPARGALWPILAMLALSFLIGVRVLLATSRTPGSGAGTQAGISWQAYGLAQGTVILRYLRMLVLPWGFSVDPAIAVPEVWVGAVAWLAVALLVLLASFEFRAWRAGFWFIAGLLLLLPSSSILPANDLAADRRMYLPMIGFATAAGLLLARLPPAVPAAVLALFTSLSVFRTMIWRTEASLWRDAVEKAPSKVRPRVQWARALDPPQALAVLDEAARLAPDDPLIPSEQGRVYLSQDRPDQALLAFGRALALAPRSADAFNNRGVALLALGQKQAAQADFERALAIAPCQFDARLNLRRLGIAAPPASGCSYSAEQAKALGGN